MKNLIKIIIAISAMLVAGSVFAAPSITFTTSSSTVQEGNSVILSWSATDAVSCSGTGFSTGGSTTGSVTVSPESTTTYSISCQGTSASTQVLQNDCGGGGIDATPTPSGGQSCMWEFDGWADVDPATGTAPPMCSRFNLQEEVCGTRSTSSCRVGDTDFVINSKSKCRVFYNKYRVFPGGQTTIKDLSVTVTPAPAVPTATLTVSPDSIISGNNTTVSWNSTNATRCIATNGSSFSTSNATSGSLSISPTVSDTYRIRCEGAGGSATAQDSVTVSAPPTPPPAMVTADLKALPSNIISGNSSTLSWSSTNATSCTGIGFNTGSLVSGSVSVSPSSNTIYSVTCTNGSSSDVDNTQVSVETPIVNPTARLSASPSSITSGSSSTLSWSSTNATYCQSGTFDTSDRTSGSVSVSPSSTTNYSVTCYAGSKTASDSARVTVNRVTCAGSGCITSPDPDPDDPSDPTDPTDPPVITGPRDCVFNGRVVPHGSSVTAYQNSAVSFDVGTCRSQLRTCTDGTLSGSYGFSTCVVQDPVPVTVECSTNNRDWRACEGLFTLRTQNDPMFVRAPDADVEAFYQCGPNTTNGYVASSTTSITRSIISRGEEVTARFATPTANVSQINYTFSDDALRSPTNEMSICLNSENALDTQDTFLIKVLNFNFTEE